MPAQAPEKWSGAASVKSTKRLLTLDVIDTQSHAAYYKFKAMHELRYYLGMLLDHQCISGNGNCPECQRLQRIYQFLQTELFTTVIYSETPLEHRVPILSQSQPVNRAAAGPRRPHAA
jgi:hypothetical protein